MGVFFLPLLPLAIPYILGGLDFLRSQLFPPAPLTRSPSDDSYTPPFLGGQCEGVRYKIDITNTDTASGALIFQVVGRDAGIGAFSEQAPPPDANPNEISRLIGGAGQFVTARSVGVTSVWNLYPSDGSADNCGNTPNPNPPPPVGGDGIADSDSPNLNGNALKIVEGAPLATLPNFGAALLAALNAVRQAANALDAIKSIADAIELLKDLLEKVNEDTKDKDKDGKKDVFRYQFGSISSDGFLRLYPNAESNRYKAEQIDINLLSIPLYYGKYFGERSPNFYRFKSLGYIAFVSPTFGIIEYKEIEFSRMSLKVPDDCIGFFYHLGLENDIAANVWGYYTQPQLIE